MRLAPHPGVGIGTHGTPANRQHVHIARHGPPPMLQVTERPIVQCGDFAQHRSVVLVHRLQRGACGLYQPQAFSVEAHGQFEFAAVGNAHQLVRDLERALQGRGCFVPVHRPSATIWSQLLLIWRTNELTSATMLGSLVTLATVNRFNMQRYSARRFAATWPPRSMSRVPLSSPISRTALPTALPLATTSFMGRLSLMR